MRFIFLILEKRFYKKVIVAISLQGLFAFLEDKLFWMKNLPIRLIFNPPFLMLISDSEKIHF